MAVPRGPRGDKTRRQVGAGGWFKVIADGEGQTCSCLQAEREPKERERKRLVSIGEDREDRIQGLQKAILRMKVKLSPFKTERERS